MKKILLPGFLLFWCLCSSAQTSHLYFDHLDVRKGLPEGMVRAIAEDGEGYMWFSTQDGLVRYDGYNYKIYDLGSATSVTNVLTLLLDANKTLWASIVGNGLYRYDRYKDGFDEFKYPSLNLKSEFHIKTADKFGNIWGEFVENKKQIAKYDLKQHRFEFFSQWGKGYNRVDAGSVVSLSKTSDGTIWFYTDNGLFRYNGPGKPLSAFLSNAGLHPRKSVNMFYEAPSQPGIFWMNILSENKKLDVVKFNVKDNKVTYYAHTANPSSIKCDTINDIYEDIHKQLWFATNSGLSKLDRSTGKFLNFIPRDTLHAADKNQFSQITESKDGKLWLNYPNGLIYFDPKTSQFERYEKNGDRQGALANHILTKMVDDDNVLWLGLEDDGVNKVDKQKSAFQFIRHLPGIPEGYLGGDYLGVLKTEGHANLLITNHGIYKWIISTGSLIKKYLPEPGQKINQAVKGKDNILYLATTNGLVALNTLTGIEEHYRHNPKDPSSIRTKDVDMCYIDHTGVVWMGMGNFQGLCSFDPKTKKITRYPFITEHANRLNDKSGALDDGWVDAIFEDRENTLWVGTNWGSINRFDRKTGKFISYYTKKNELMNGVTDIYEDTSGRFWVGTYFNGLFEFDRKRGTYIFNINRKSGLLINSVQNINEDTSGQLWISSYLGFTKLNPKTKTVKNFSMDDILPGEDFVWLDRQKTNDEKFILALKSGLTLFDPAELDNPFPPKVHIESIAYSNPEADDSKVNRELVYGKNVIKLYHDRNRVQFNYIALQYDNPSKNTYEYKLDNYDKQWVKAGPSRSVTYNNLSPGTYVFHIKAANNSGVWSKNGDSVVIIINKPWWLRWWACLLYLISFTASVYAFVTYRSRKLLAYNRALENKVRVRTEKVSQQKEEIESQRDHLEKAFTDLKAVQNQLIQSEKMASLGELTAGIAHEIQNPLNFVNNFSEVNMEIIDELKQELKSGNIDEALALADGIQQNEDKINHHGKRADSIVKGMLQHSRAVTGERQLTDINALADEFVKLSYHGLRAKDKSFNAEIVTHFETSLLPVAIIAHDIGRVLLNLFNNAFYAVNQKSKIAVTDYKPTIEVSTFTPSSGGWDIKVKDNGVGIPENIRDKIMQPFFTTKPTGEGTGAWLIFKL